MLPVCLSGILPDHSFNTKSERPERTNRSGGEGAAATTSRPSNKRNRSRDPFGYFDIIMPVKLLCHVVPNAKQDTIAGQLATVSPSRGGHGSAIKIKLRAPAVAGKANAALRRFLAEKLQVAARDIVLERGEKCRDKIVRIDGLSEPELWRRLGVELSGK